MTTTLRPSVDLGPVLKTVALSGAALVPDALNEAFLHQLQLEVAVVPFETMPEQEGRAYQGGEVFGIYGSLSGYPWVEELGSELTQRVRDAGTSVEGCTSWRPNAVHVQRYKAGDLGITPHLDLKRYHYLVAIVTAWGAAPFVICKNREGDALHAWTADAGSLVLLRGPGLGGAANGRPLHSVRGPTHGHRISVSYRMDTSVG